MYKDRSLEYYHTFSGERERERGKCRDVRGIIQVRAPNMKLKYVNPWPSFYITSAVELVVFPLGRCRFESKKCRHFLYLVRIQDRKG